MKCLPLLWAALLPVMPAQGAAVIFWSQTGSDSSVDDSLDGAVVPDRLGANSYEGFLGELLLMPTIPQVLANVPIGSAGVASADVGGTFGTTRGLIGYCIDSETSFSVSASLASTYSYTAHAYESANARYLQEGVSYYRDGALKRAGYLMENYCMAAHQGGDIEAAALQAAIWEVLYDEIPNVSTGNGNYYIRSISAQRVGVPVTNTALVQQLANQWLQLAEANQWGGTAYDPGSRVLYWLNDDGTGINQSIITLNPPGSVDPVPEPAAAALLAAGVLGLAGRRRRTVNG